jgi:hypothetical protein
MSRRGFIPFFLLLTLGWFWVGGSASATPPVETLSASPSLSESTQNTRPHNKASSKKLKTRTSKKSKDDFWTHCQKMKGSLYKGDLDDSVYPKDPIMEQMPGVKPDVLPCRFQPDTKSLPGGRAKCSF